MVEVLTSAATAVPDNSVIFAAATEAEIQSGYQYCRMKCTPRKRLAHGFGKDIFYQCTDSSRFIKEEKALARLNIRIYTENKVSTPITEKRQWRIKEAVHKCGKLHSERSNS